MVKGTRNNRSQNAAKGILNNPRNTPSGTPINAAPTTTPAPSLTVFSVHSDSRGSASVWPTRPKGSPSEPRPICGNTA